MPVQEFDAGPLADLDDVAMREVEVQGEKVLLIREGADIFAVSGVCPHPGTPIAEGIRHGSSIVCPWHKAAFCLRTGALLEPPAVDPLGCLDVGIESGRIKFSRREPAAAVTPVVDERRFVIVGGGGNGCADVVRGGVRQARDRAGSRESGSL